MNERVSETNIPDAIAAFSALETEGQARFLARFAHNLTVAARDAYVAGGYGLTDPARVRAINEVQHRVTGHLRMLLEDDPKRYPDDVLVRMFLEGNRDPYLDWQIFVAFDRAMSPTKATG